MLLLAKSRVGDDVTCYNLITIWMCRVVRWFIHSVKRMAGSKIGNTFKNTLYNLLLSLTVILNVYRTTFIKYCLTQWFSKFLINFTGLTVIVNATVYTTEPIFTCPGHGKLSEFYFNTGVASYFLWLSVQRRQLKGLRHSKANSNNQTRNPETTQN